LTLHFTTYKHTSPHNSSQGTSPAQQSHIHTMT